MKVYLLLGKVVMVTSLITPPLVFAVPILLIFKMDSGIMGLIGLALLLSISLYISSRYYRDKYTTDHLKNGICPNCKSRELSFSERGELSGHKYDMWACRKCGYGWEHTQLGKNYGYNRYVQKENERYKRI